MKIDLQGQYGFAAILQVMGNASEQSDSSPVTGPGEGGFPPRSHLYSKIGDMGEGGRGGAPSCLFSKIGGEGGDQELG